MLFSPMKSSAPHGAELPSPAGLEQSVQHSGVNLRFPHATEKV